MDKELFDDLLKSTEQAIEYAEGNNTKARSQMLTIADEEVEISQLNMHKRRG